MSDSVRISYLPGGERDRDPVGITLAWADLARALGRDGIDAAPCVLETCGRGEHEHVWRDKNGKERRGGCRHKYGKAWSPAVYPPGATRANGSVGVVSLLVLDVDHATEAGVSAVAGKLAGLRYVAHGSHSDRRPAPRGETGELVLERALRVVVALSEPVPGKDWKRFRAAALRHLGIEDDPDPATKDPSRLYFLPVRRSDCPAAFASQDGAPLDVPMVMGLAEPAGPEVGPLDGATGDLGPASPEVLAEARDRLRRVGPAVEGEGGDARTYSLCCALLHDLALSEAEAWPILAEWNETCRPPWAADELRTKMENARSYAEGPRGAGRLEVESSALLAELAGASPPLSSSAPSTMADAPGDPDAPIDEGDVLAILGGMGRAAVAREQELPGAPGEWAHELERARRDVGRALAAGVGDATDPAQGRLFQAATELLAEPPRPASWLVERLLTEGGVSGIVGEPKTTKSWQALEFALAVASGTPVFGCERYRVPRPRPAAYFFAEDHRESVVSRIRALAAGRGISPAELARNLHVQPRGEYLDLSKDEDVARVVASARMCGQLGLLVLDPLRDVHSGKENESDDMAAVFKRLRLISVLLDCAVLVVHHAKKPGKEGSTNGNEIRGSSVINGALDARIILKGMTGDGECVFTNTVEALVKRGRSAGTFVVTLTIADGPDGTAEVARWQHATRADASNAAENEKSGAAVEVTALAMVRHLLLTEARREACPPVRKFIEALRPCGQTRFYAAAEHGCGRGWLLRRGDKYQVTDAAREYVRELDAPPPAPAASTLEDVLAATE